MRIGKSFRATASLYCACLPIGRARLSRNWRCTWKPLTTRHSLRVCRKPKPKRARGTLMTGDCWNANWKKFSRDGLAVLRLPPDRESEIVEELALHLEAAYDEALTEGLSKTEAEARTGHTYDWRLLECELEKVFARRPRCIAPASRSGERDCRGTGAAPGSRLRRGTH